jgi:hypothetical protein
MMTTSDNKVYIGYHGTNYENVESIIKHGFHVSDNADEWLGHGIYFFTEGISDPIENAKEWAINQAWDKENKRYCYKKYAVLKVEVSGERVLDLTTENGLRSYNEMRNLLIHKYESLFHRDRNISEDNCKMSNLIVDAMNLDILINRLYIKNGIQRKLRLVSNVPNTTVMVVIKPESIVSIKIVSSGEIR